MAEAGDTVTIGASGDLATLTGDNGFLGMRGSHRGAQYESGNEVTVHIGNVATAAVAAGVEVGEALEEIRDYESATKRRVTLLTEVDKVMMWKSRRELERR